VPAGSSSRSPTATVEKKKPRHAWGRDGAGQRSENTNNLTRRTRVVTHLQACARRLCERARFNSAIALRFNDAAMPANFARSRTFLARAFFCFKAAFFEAAFFDAAFFEAAFFEATFLGAAFFDAAFFDAAFFDATFFDATFFDATFFDAAFFEAFFEAFFFFANITHK